MRKFARDVAERDPGEARGKRGIERHAKATQFISSVLKINNGSAVPTWALITA